VLHSEACLRNQQPILEVLQDWLPPQARVLEVGSGSGQHGRHFCRHLPGLRWQPSERAAGLQDLLTASQLGAVDPDPLAAGAQLAMPVLLDVTRPADWPAGPWDAVFSANTCHILPEAALPPLLAGSARVLRPGGLLLLYGPFSDGGLHNSPGNAAFDAHLRSLDPAMGIRDLRQLLELARDLALEPLAEVAMPANNRMVILERRTPAGL
jgi:SAM-dependent methyltransferase